MHIAFPLDPSAPPPQNYQQRPRQSRRDGLSQQRRREPSQRNQVCRALSRFVEFQVCQRRCQVEDSAQRALLFRDPGDRFHAERMQSKHQTGEPRPGKSQPPGDLHHQASRQGVQGHINQVIEENGVAPDRMLHPERAVQQRIILLGRSGVGPNTPEAMQRPEIEAGHMAGIVPQHCPAQSRQVSHEGGANNEREGAQVLGQPP